MDEDLILAVRFITDRMPIEMAPTVRQILLEGNLTGIMNQEQQFMNNCQWKATGKPEHDNTLAANGMMLGFALAVCVKTNPQVIADIKNFFEFMKKERGENVHDFGEYRAKRTRTSKITDHSGGPGPTG